MKPVIPIAMLLLACTAAAHAESATPKTKRVKPAAITEQRRRDLERRIEALEQKYEMHYRETESPAAVPAPAGGAAPAAKPASH